MIKIQSNIINNVSPLRTQKHPFHIVDPSPWPFIASISAFSTVLGLTAYMHFYIDAIYDFLMSLFFLIIIMALWWRDVIREATFEGQHTSYVRKGLKLGMILFIISEAMLFFAFFWAFFSCKFKSNNWNWMCMTSKRNYCN